MPGVTSISADVHKYGFASKGASTITYRDLGYFKHQMFVSQNWPGGVFASPALLGTRPGGSYAAAWAALQYFGISGYRDLAARTAQAVDRLCAGVSAIAGLRMLATPQGPLIAYGSSRSRRQHIRRWRPDGGKRLDHQPIAISGRLAWHGHRTAS